VLAQMYIIPGLGKSPGVLSENWRDEA